MEMKKAILNTVDKRLTFIFRDKEFVVDVKGMDSDHWDTIKDERTNIEYDINIWFDEFYNGVNSFQLCVYELLMNHDKTGLTIGDSLESYDVVAINEQGLIIDGDELELAMFDYDVDVQSIDYIKKHYTKMELSIDNESVDIYIDNGDTREPSHICYWHLDEVEGDSSVAISIANAINLFHTNKLKLIETLFGKVK
jgi:hypothetical protein